VRDPPKEGFWATESMTRLHRALEVVASIHRDSERNFPKRVWSGAGASLSLLISGLQQRKWGFFDPFRRLLSFSSKLVGAFRRVSEEVFSETERPVYGVLGNRYGYLWTEGLGFSSHSRLKKMEARG
jgi:hypothetical protein